MDNYDLNSLILENFKIFKGQHVFNFNDLNIFTGTNNSGKSTIIKAINFFSKSLEKGDFPIVDLMGVENEYGDFDSLVNSEALNQSFKIGTFIKIGRIRNRFKLLFTFVKGDQSTFRCFQNECVFQSIEIINERGQIFFGIYNSDVYKSNLDTIEFELEEVARKYPFSDYARQYARQIERGNDEGYGTPFITPTEDFGPGLVFIKINHDLLGKYVNDITDQDFSSLIVYLQQLKSNKGNCWFECFSEDSYSYRDYSIYDLTFGNLLKDLKEDDYLNFGDYPLRYALFNDSERQDEEKKYKDLVNNHGYIDFLDDFVFEILNSINEGVEVFRGKSVVHIGYQIFDKQTIPINDKYEYLRSIYKLLDDSNFYHFFYEAMNIFGLDWYVDLKNIAHSFFELKMITTVNKQVKEIEDEQDLLKGLVITGIPNFEPNPKINIHNLGKGSASLAGIVLNISSILISYEKEIDKKIRFHEWEGSKPEKVVQKTILIEEPEVFLHPDWQSKLADLFIFCSQSFNEHYGKKHNLNVKFVIETHSVYLIQRMQLLAARKAFDPKKVDILYFNKKDEKEKFYKITLREDGILDQGFGTGFYDETANLTADILNARKLN